MEADSCRFEEKLAFRGRGLGPWTEQESLIVEDDGMIDFAFPGGASSSRYADPEADFTSPVCRT